jgi:class 3 adenylate cyclase/tetratricopeptide (TPR) repeat protein
MNQVRTWLAAIGLAQYADAFETNDIEMDLLGQLDDRTLKDIGVASAGHRLRIHNAVAKLATTATPDANEEAPSTAAHPSTVSAERRQVTVMFCDLVGSTALSVRMDPEDLREIISGYHKSVAETVRRLGGFVAKYMGDGVLVYFGYPKAHEDDAERAVRVGLALIEVVGKLSSEEPLRVRVGIATGLVVIGDLIGEGEAQERGIVGETPNLAARLQGIAEPNMVVISDSTRKLVGGLFEFADLGPRDLKGLAGPARAWAALRENSVESRFEAFHGAGLTPLVGREEESDLLLRSWSRAKTGDGQVVLLSGEAGIGKSRLTASLLEGLVGEPHARLRYFSSPERTDSALHPIIGQMERVANLTHDDMPQARLDKLDTLLGHTSTSSEHVALFAEMLSLPNDGRYPALELTPQQRRQRTMDALILQIEALTHRSPVLMIFEDAHWTDPTSLELLGRVVDRIPGLRVLLIVTFRPEFEAAWIGHPHVTALTLNRLAQRDVFAMIDRVVGNGMLPASIRQDIIERTDGIPLFVEEMTKALLESGEALAARVASAIPSTPMGVPATLHASLMARLDRLGSAKEIAQIGAVIGREFSYDLLAAVTGLDTTTLGGALDRLGDAGLVFQQGSLPHASFLFKHALVQEAAYATLLRGPRQNLHARIAIALEERFPETVAARSELLAQHYARAGMIEKAVTNWLRAGQQAIERSAMMEALALLRKGLDQVSQLSEGAQRQEHELELQLAFGRALMATRGFAAPEVGEICARTRQLCDQLDRPQSVPVLFGEWVHHFLRAELHQAREGAKEMLLLGEDQNDIPLKGLGLRTFGMASFCLGDFSGCRDNLDHAVALYHPSQLGYYTALSPSDSSVVMRLWHARSLAWLGHLDQARTDMATALAEARLLGHAFTLTHALVEICIAEWGLCSPESLLVNAEELLSLAEQFTMFEPQGMILRGWCLTALGREDETLLITRGLAAFRATGSNLWVPFFLTLLADAYGMTGKPEEGLSCLDEAARLIEFTQERCTESEVHRVRGKLLSLLGDMSAAARSFHVGMEIARSQQARLFELRAATGLARIWRDQGKPNEARELLAPVYSWFTEGFDTLDLKEAKALLGELAA